MRQLHVVALSEDGRSVLLAPTKGAKAGTFSLSLDGKLAAAVRGDVPRLGEQEAREVGVTPKEIQARLRAGESVEQIADAEIAQRAAEIDRRHVAFEEALAIEGPAGVIMLGLSTAYLVSLLARLKLLRHDWLTLDECERRDVR